MRISTAMMYDRGTQAMLDQQRQLSKTQLQLATGQRITTPEDDPPGATRVMNLTREIETTSQFQRNASRAQARLELEDATLQGVTEMLQRIRELTVQAANDTYVSSDRQAIAYEVAQLRDQLFGMANTRDSNGEFIFAGYRGNAVPAAFSETATGVVYNGDLGQRKVQIAYQRQVADSDSGWDVFVKSPSRIDADRDGNVESLRNVFDTLDLLGKALVRSGVQLPDDPTHPDQIRNYIDEIDSAINNITDVRAKVGGRLNAIDEQDSVNRSYSLSMETSRSVERDLDYASAISDYQRQLLGLQAAQQSFAKLQNLTLFNYI